MREFINFLIIIDIFLLLGFGGSYENNIYTTKQFLILTIICFVVFIFLEHSKNALSNWHCNKAHKK